MGEYSWLMALKNWQILFDDSRADKQSSTCWGSEKVLDVGSPGLAVMLLTCLNQLFLEEPVRLTCLLRKSVVASLSFLLTSFLAPYTLHYYRF